ncbi:UvrD-helicase domain-containing protein [Streptomyces xanthochromogenes]|uniref:UvrD-helicase domain-containing protein n=1 Tax=Streptomyces xanthochromogenes TaxID=67384 RepID=UPI00380C2006
MLLFATEPLKGLGRPAAPLPLSKQLNILILRLVRETGRGYSEINISLNRRLGVSTRTGASDALLERGIALAEQYLAQVLATEPPVAIPTLLSPPAADMPEQRSRSARSRPAGPKPTGEQDRAAEAMLARENFALQAGAGTGKTTTLAMLARAATARRRGMFLAFNRPVVEDAARKFPTYVECRTGHSVAMKAIGHRYGDRLRQPREPSWKVGQRLGIDPRTQLRLGDRVLTNRTFSYMALATLARFCYSADDEITAKHVPQLRGLADEYRADVARVVLPYAQRAWRDVQDPKGQCVRFDPNHALKIWSLTEPRIKADYLLLDEAQDTNPVMEKIFTAQRSHAQLVMVGDSAQAIYGWRGARDVMTGFDGRQLTLSQSFRFGPALAAEANRWLAIVESPLRLNGTPTIDTRIGPLEHAQAVLCRSNAGAIGEVFRLLDQEKRVALVGEKALQELARAAGDLKAGRRATHPDLVLFQSWGELVEYAEEDPEGQDLLPLVEIIEKHGVGKVLDAMGRLDAESDADFIVSTAHKAKGREWDTVRVANDFREPTSRERDPNGNPLPGPLSIEDGRLAYVAVTRARRHLDLGGLSWIEDHPDGCPGGRPLSGSSPLGPSPWDRLGPPPACPPRPSPSNSSS